jgi:hypothetical protein
MKLNPVVNENYESIFSDSFYMEFLELLSTQY